MAYRKKTVRRRTSHSRRRDSRRMGAASRRLKREGSGTRLIGLIVGAVAPALISTIKMKDKSGVEKPLDAKIVGGISVAVGYFLPNFLKGDIFKGIGDGMIAGGGAILVNDLGLLNGLPLIAGPGFNAINGPGEQKSAETLKESAAYTSYQPTVSQMINGIYNRGYRD